MMTKTIATFLLCIGIIWSNTVTELDSLTNTRVALHAAYQEKMQELEKSASERWGIRQKAILEKEQNKENLTSLRSAIENLYADIARSREEKLIRENSVLAEEETLREQQESWEHTKALILDKKERITDNISQDFPLFLEARLGSFSAVDTRFPGDRYPIETFEALIEALRKDMIQSSKTELLKETIITDENESLSMTILRVGYAFAIGTTDSLSYYLNYFGREVSNPFRWQQVHSANIAQMIRQTISTAEISLNDTLLLIPVDIMQNRQSQEIISAKKVSFFQQAQEFLQAGGFIVYPLILLLAWALYIIINRGIVFQTKHTTSTRFINKTVTLLENGDFINAQKHAEKQKGILPHILLVCLKHRDYSRNRAEKEVKEQLLSEVPQLNKHLDTLAVLASAAPMLGLLGTVTGMISMFKSITTFGTGDPTLLAGGISEALITTEIGLAIAIPLLLIHTFLSNRRNEIQSELESYAMRILNRLWPAE